MGTQVRVFDSIRATLKADGTIQTIEGNYYGVTLDDNQRPILATVSAVPAVGLDGIPTGDRAPLAKSLRELAAALETPVKLDDDAIAALTVQAPLATAAPFVPSIAGSTPAADKPGELPKPPTP